jgi:hypothetical protein
MNMRNQLVSTSIFAIALAGALSLGAPGADAQKKILRADTGSPGAASHAVIVVLGKVWQKELGITIQVNDSQTLTRSAMKLGRGQLEIMPFPTSIYGFLSKGSRMYKKKLHKEAIAASKNVRSIWGWQAVLFHPVTFDIDGIKTFADLKGKRVFTGPPSGAAAVTSETMIRALTGYEANKDYKAIRLPWGGGLQAMMDGKLDVFMRPDGLGSAMIEQLGLTRKFRLLNAADSSNKEQWGKWLKGLGREPGVIPAGTYKGQVNNNLNIATGAITFQIGINKTSISEEMAYNMTKLTWAKLDEIHNTASLLRTINKSKPFVGVNMPLHVGAVRYYREMGIKIPAVLIPPEAK